MDGSFSTDGIAGWDKAFLNRISKKLERYEAMQLELIQQPDISAKQAMLATIEDLEAEIIREALFKFSPDDQRGGITREGAHSRHHNSFAICTLDWHRKLTCCGVGRGAGNAIWASEPDAPRCPDLGDCSGERRSIRKSEEPNRRRCFGMGLRRMKLEPQD